MTPFENEFEKIVNTIRFDDTPRETHRRKLEQHLLEAYDQRQSPAAAPSGVFYLRRVAMAAGIAIAAGLLVWFLDGNGPVSNGHPAHAPDPQTIERILRQEKASGTQRKALLSEIRQVWKRIAAQDIQGLTAVVLDDQVARGVRHWAGESVASMGTEETLGMLEKHCEVHALSDPNDPVVHTARQLRKRLESPPQNDE